MAFVVEGTYSSFFFSDTKDDKGLREYTHVRFRTIPNREQFTFGTWALEHIFTPRRRLARIALTVTNVQDTPAELHKKLLNLEKKIWSSIYKSATDVI